MTYSETRQRIYFDAAVALYKLVVEIAEENIDNAPEGEVTPANLAWAQSLVETTFLKALALEEQGHAECIAPARSENRLSRAREAAKARTAEGRALKAAIVAKFN